METSSSGQMDALLNQLAGEGELNSTGRFTLALEKLSEKLAAFQFERPGQWILKIVQALVASGADSISIRQSYRCLQIEYGRGKVGWSHLELQEAYLTPGIEGSPGVKHLVSALWFVTFNQGCRWTSVLANCDQALAGSPADLASLRVEPPEFGRLEIEFPLVGGPGRAADISRELSLHAYTCPIPLDLEGHRIDSLKSWSNGCQLRPVQDRRFPGVKEQIEVMSVGLESGELEGEPWRWSALLTAHVQTMKVRDLVQLGPFPRDSSLNWVLDGVIVGQETLPTKSAASCQLFVSARELPIDLSGLKLVRNHSALNPSLPVALAVRQWLAGQTIEIEAKAFESSWQHRPKSLFTRLGLGFLFQKSDEGSSSDDAALDLKLVLAQELQELRQQWRQYCERLSADKNSQKPGESLRATKSRNQR